MCFLLNFVSFSSLWNWKFTQLWVIESHLSKCLLRWGKSLLPLFLLQPLLLQFWWIKHKEPHERSLCLLLEVSVWTGDLSNTRNVLPKWPSIEQAESCEKLLKMMDCDERRQIKKCDTSKNSTRFQSKVPWQLAEMWLGRNLLIVVYNCDCKSSSYIFP